MEFIKLKLINEELMKHITKNNKVILKPVNRNTSFVSGNIRVNAGVVKKRGIYLTSSHSKGTQGVNAIKKQYGVKVTKGFAIISFSVLESTTKEQLAAFIKWLKSIKVDKQIQQVEAVLSEKDGERVIVATFICAMTSTLILTTVLTSLNCKFFDLDLCLDVSQSPPSLYFDVAATISNGWVGLIKEPDFQPFIPLFKLFENAFINLKFASVDDLIKSGKLESIFKTVLGWPSNSQEFQTVNELLTSNTQSILISNLLKQFLKTVLTSMNDQVLLGGIENIELIKSVKEVIICNQDNVLNLSFNY